MPSKAIGHPDTRLVVLRGNSASGKSTVAAALRARLGRGVALVQQDVLRRGVLGEHDRAGLPNIGLIETTIAYALDAGYHVIAEGIFVASHYGQMLRAVSARHAGRSHFYYFDISLLETFRRHATKPATSVGPDRLGEWFVPHDILAVPGETLIDDGESEEQIVRRILREVPFPAPPVTRAYVPEAHL